MHAVGILTFHRCINYGSYWQAKCLVEGLRRRGVDAVLLDHRSRRVDWAELRCAVQPLLPVRTRSDDVSSYKAKVRAFFRAFDDLPMSEPFALDTPDAMPPVDLALVGSDEVWNLKHPWYGGCPAFWGEGLRARRIAAYATSCGNFAPDNGLDPWWADKLGNFADISVRDHKARRMVEQATGTASPLVLDPCLQFPEVIREAGAEDAIIPYVAVYGHSFSDGFRDAVRRWAGARGLPLISIGYRNDWADAQLIEAGPDDFARFMAGARAVATNFFHGCVFSLVNGKPFACALSDYRFHKVRDLMTTLGADNRLMRAETPDAAYDAALSLPMEPAVIRQIDALRRQSDTYLDHVLRFVSSPAEPEAAVAE